VIRFADFMPVPAPERTKVKFNIRAGVGGAAAYDLLLADDPEPWLAMTRYRSRQQNNNMGRAEYVLTFAQYYPYGPEYFMFGASSASSRRFPRQSATTAIGSLRSSLTPSTSSASS
jgi:hypothetical protein